MTTNEVKLQKLIMRFGCVQPSAYNVKNFMLTGEENDEDLEQIAQNYIDNLDKINDRFTEICYSKTQR